ncbi:methyl-CPG-binding domain 7 [Perilla frutescens var. hirtella]|nr:methyl-CPG-binding domain 7 [Perilla frutescens var. hirtella]KAH6810967.1 methyl-CPG-binding domain 7 [Perilla frutescens var. frutescens]
MEQRHRSTLSPSNSMLVPYARRKLAVVPVPATASASRLTIPRGWGIKEVPRPDGSRSDRYYYEPGSGRKFRSTKEVHRYLSGEPYCFKSRSRMIVPFKRSAGYRRMMVSGGKLLRVDNARSKNHLAVVRAAPSILPDGWIVEEIPRSYMNFTDKYYYEPESGQKFRSLVAIERYLAELNDDDPLSKTLEEIMENKPLAQAFKMENHKSSAQRKKNASREKSQASSFLNPPMKVTWVLATAQGDSWNPFICEASVPDAVKQQWTNRFMLLMKDGTSNFQNTRA